jgi:hypothetical protein
MNPVLHALVVLTLRIILLILGHKAVSNVKQLALVMLIVRSLYAKMLLQELVAYIPKIVHAITTLIRKSMFSYEMTHVSIMKN